MQIFEIIIGITLQTNSTIIFFIQIKIRNKIQGSIQLFKAQNPPFFLNLLRDFHLSMLGFFL